MWELISLKEQSKIKMIEMFYATDEPITINTLSETTNTSIRSIKNYLEELKETMNEVGGKFHSSSEGINFKIPMNIGFDYFQKQLFKQSSGFMLLEKIFFDETLTNDQLINELYISSSTLNRLTKTVSKALKPYGLKLESSPYKIIGDEQLIRSFFTTYFVEAYTASEWPFKGLRRKLIDDILPSAMDYYQSTSELMNYTYFKFQFAVGLIRNLQGYSLENKLAKNASLTSAYKKLSITTEEKIDYVMFNSINEKNSYVSELVMSQLFTSRQVLHTRLMQDNNFKHRIEDIKQMIDFLTDHFELLVEDQTNLILEINNTLSFFAESTEEVQPPKTILYPPRDYHLIKLYQRKYSTFYDGAEYYMSLLCSDRGFKPTNETLDYLIYLLISKWKGLTKQLFGRYNTITMKVYSHLSLRHAQNIAESLASDLPNAVEVSTFEEPVLNEEVISNYNFDILVTTETLLLDIKQPIIYMYKSRSSYQYNYLQKLIREQATQKEQMAREKFIKKRPSFPYKKETSTKLI